MKIKKSNNSPICQSEVGYLIELVESNGFAVAGIEYNAQKIFKLELEILPDADESIRALIKKNVEAKNYQTDSI